MAHRTLLLATLGLAAGCKATDSGTQLTGALAFPVAASFAVAPPSGPGQFDPFPGTVTVVLESLDAPEAGAGVDALACQSFFLAANGVEGAVVSTGALQLTLISPDGGALLPGTFPLVIAAEDAGLARLIFESADAGTLVADGGSVTLTAVPLTDAGAYVGSFSARMSGGSLQGDFSAPYCAPVPAS